MYYIIYIILIQFFNIYKKIYKEIMLTSKNQNYHNLIINKIEIN